MLKKFLIALGIFTLVIALTALTIALVYEEQVKKIIVEQVNKQLIAPVKVGEIKFSLIKNFPKASLSFYNVEATSVYKGEEQNKCSNKLLVAEEISLQFNLVDIFNGNYTINKISLHVVQLFLFVDGKNFDNYHFWKTDTSKVKSKVTFRMSQILMNDIDVNYHNIKQQIIFQFLFKDAKMYGEVFDEDFALMLNSNLTVKNFQLEKNNFFKNKSIALNIGLLRKNKVFSFNKANASIEKLRISLSGSFSEEEFNFEAQGQELDIHSFISLMPENLSKKFVDYTSEGLFALDLMVKGKQNQPQIRAGFNIENAKFGQKSSNVELHHINLRGYYSNGRAQNMHTSGVYVNTFNASLNKSPIEGNFSVVDFTNPFVDGNLKASFMLDELKEILQLDTFKVLQGSANLDLHISCPLDQLKKQDISQTKKGQISGSLLLKEAQFKFRNDEVGYENLNADLYADDNYILVKQLNFLHGKSQVELRGELSNYQALLNNNKEKSLLRAYLNAANFELEDWLPKQHNTAKNIKKQDEIYLNQIDLKLIAQIARFKFDQFIATNVSSNIYFTETQFRFDSLQFICMDGNANASGAIDLQQNGGFDLICDAKLSKISINKLFEQLNNFGQKTLTYQNLAGKLSADIQYKSSWSNLNHIIPESILAEANLLITDGRLDNFTPLNKLSKFVSVNELSHIKFSELANTISISNKKIYIPQFQINSSAMNLYCSGTHDFDNNINYHFKVTLSELLSKKRAREVPKNNEFNEIEESEDGKTNLFISMTGNIDNPKIKFDKKELKKFVKDEIKNEKQTVKQLLKDEFGLFKKDNSLKEQTEKKEPKQKEFDVEWEEEPSKEKKVQEPPFNKSIKGFGGDQKPKQPKNKSKQKQEENSDDFL
jgi:hypothetical protein